MRMNWISFVSDNERFNPANRVNTGENHIQNQGDDVLMAELGPEKQLFHQGEFPLLGSGLLQGLLQGRFRGPDVGQGHPEGVGGGGGQ